MLKLSFLPLSIIFQIFNTNSSTASHDHDFRNQQSENSNIHALLMICRKSRDKGHICLDEGPSIMWHYDETTAQCLAFKFNGCGGNGNRFDTKDDCEQACIAHPQNHSGCIARRNAHVVNGRTVICDGTNASDCPREYICKIGVGVCCHARTNYSWTICSQNVRDKEPIQVEESSFPTLLLGTGCSDHFCPEGTKCHQNSLVAFCCSNNNLIWPPQPETTIQPPMTPTTKQPNKKIKIDKCAPFESVESWQNVVCGPRGYLLGFGRRHCDALLYGQLKRFDRNGRELVPCLVKCWMNIAIEFIEEHESRWHINCTTLWEQAHSKHISCYQGCPLCAALNNRNIFARVFSDNTEAFEQLLRAGENWQNN